jgi:hypothetical protein
MFLTNIYGPCNVVGRAEFTNWLYNYDVSNFDLWLVTSDFNLMRGPENINSPGVSTCDMLLFNDIIHHLDLVEVHLKNRIYTWSNMQDPCLLEKFDWVFTSSSWILVFLNTMAYALPQIIFDHVPYVVQMGSSIPRANIFRIENY